MNLETYGLLPENPILLDSEKAVIGYLESLVTKEKAYHLIYHKLMSFDFNLFYGLKKTYENNIEVYQICTNDNKLMSLFFNIYNDTCVWIPSAPFDFERDTILICDIEMTADSEAEYSLVKVNKKYVSEIKTNWKLEDFEKYYPDDMEYIVLQNWGVNYKTDNFPKQLWEKHFKENCYCITELTEERLALRLLSPS